MEAGEVMTALIKGKLGRFLLPFYLVRTKGKSIICEPGNRFSPNTQSVGFLILDFQLPELEEHFCGFEVTLSIAFYYSSLQGLGQRHCLHFVEDRSVKVGLTQGSA